MSRPWDVIDDDDGPSTWEVIESMFAKCPLLRFLDCHVRNLSTLKAIQRGLASIKNQNRDTFKLQMFLLFIDKRDPETLESIAFLNQLIDTLMESEIADFMVILQIKKFVVQFRTEYLQERDDNVTIEQFQDATGEWHETERIIIKNKGCRIHGF